MTRPNVLATLALAAAPILLLGCDPGEEKEAADGATSEVVDGDDDGGGEDGGDGGDSGSGSGDDSGSGSGSDSGSGSGGDSGSGSGGDSGSGSGDDGDDGGEGGEGTGDDGSSPMELTNDELVGFTWQLELAEADISEPPVVGGILTSVFTDSLLYGITGSGSDTLDMALAVGTPSGSGFRVGDVLDLGAGDFSAPPDFEVDGSGTTLDYPYDGVDIPFEDPIFVGTMSTDGESLDTIELTSKIDTRDIGPLFALEDTDTAVCEFVGALGVTCDSCNDGEPLCLNLVAEWTNAPMLEGISLE